MLCISDDPPPSIYDTGKLDSCTPIESEQRALSHCNRVRERSNIDHFATLGESYNTLGPLCVLREIKGEDRETGIRVSSIASVFFHFGFDPIKVYFPPPLDLCCCGATFRQDCALYTSSITHHSVPSFEVQRSSIISTEIIGSPSSLYPRPSAFSNPTPNAPHNSAPSFPNHTATMELWTSWAAFVALGGAVGGYYYITSRPQARPSTSSRAPPPAKPEKNESSRPRKRVRKTVASDDDSDRRRAAATSATPSAPVPAEKPPPVAVPTRDSPPSQGQIQSQRAQDRAFAEASISAATGVLAPGTNKKPGTASANGSATTTKEPTLTNGSATSSKKSSAESSANGSANGSASSQRRRSKEELPEDRQMMREGRGEQLGEWSLQGQLADMQRAQDESGWSTVSKRKVKREGAKPRGVKGVEAYERWAASV